MLASIETWVTDVIDALGYMGVAVLVALESVFPPIPSEVVLPLAGFVAGQGNASLVGMILAATAGSLVGAWILYGLAAWIGHDRLHGFIERHGRWFGVKPSDIAKAEAWFDRRSSYAVFLGRCVPVVRSLVSIPAGFRRMPLLRFSVLTAAGSAIWNIALISAGALLGDRWEEVGGIVGIFQWAVVVVIAGLIAWFLWKRVRSNLRERAAAAAGGGDAPQPDEQDVLGASPFEH